MFKEAVWKGVLETDSPLMFGKYSLGCRVRPNSLLPLEKRVIFLTFATSVGINEYISEKPLLPSLTKLTS